MAPTTALILLLFLTIGTAGRPDSGRILFYMPFVSKSIKITFMPVAEELAKRGHNVTVFMNHQSQTRSNVTEIILESDFGQHAEELSQKALSDDGLGFAIFNEEIKEGLLANERALRHPDMKRLTDDPATTFDIVFTAPLMGNEAGYYLAHHFNASLALFFSGQGSLAHVDRALGTPHHLGYIPFFMTEFTHPMTFLQRMMNFIGSNVFQIARQYYLLPQLDEMLSTLFPTKDSPSIFELEQKTALAFSFGHPAIGVGSRPTAPNYVPLGMMNCRKPEALPQDLQDFMDSSAEHGVVYVAFGSMLQLSKMSEAKQKVLMGVLAKLEQNVLMKWETDKMPNKPENVKLSKWLPQQDILGHPNTRLFITHAGQSSSQETLCHRIPVVAIPVSFDQPANAREIERVGHGIAIPFNKLEQESLYQSIQKLLKDPTYLKRAQDQGTILMDQINHPLDRAVWWTEHLLHYPGLPHLRSPVHDLNWYQYHMLDVFALLAAILFMITFGTWWICKTLGGKLFRAVPVTKT